MDVKILSFKYEFFFPNIWFPYDDGTFTTTKKCLVENRKGRTFTRTKSIQVKIEKENKPSIHVAYNI